MTKPITNELMYEILKAIQADMADVKRDIRSMKDEIISLRTIMGEFIKTDARRETDILHVLGRVERIEHRLDLQDHPKA